MFAFLALALIAFAPPPQQAAHPRAQAPEVRVAAAGDIASCESDGDEQTAALVERMAPDAVLTLGDNAYPEGSEADFANCYDPSWGAFRDITYPAPGNHEYLTARSAGFFSYFSRRAPAAYRSFNLGAWHIVALNSELPSKAGSPQERWLRRDLARDRHRCELLYWHRPRWSTGRHGSDPGMQALWQAAYDNAVELVLTGHDHSYQRFRRLDGRGRHEPRLGVRELVVGTGGASHYEVGTAKNLVVADGSTFGVLELRLRPRDYDLTFVPVAGGTFRDALRGRPCHAPPTTVR